MNTTRAKLSPFKALPVALALLFNAMVPVLSIAAPAELPEPFSAPQQISAASDPQHVNFTLQGCRLPAGENLPASLVCLDAWYTIGNLGKSWNELDLVPHRLTTSLGTQSNATTEYTIGIAADNIETGIPGYDVITVPVVNAAKSHASCSVSAWPTAADDPDGFEVIPGVGGTDVSLGRLLTISQDKGSTCVFDWVQRLALGSSGFPGSSLHTNRTNQQWSTQGIGAADVSIPVKEIEPQELDKDMTATQGQTYGWSVSKLANPTSLNFANTCLETAGARSAQVQVTVTWTRTGPTGSGDTTITTNIFATNPAHRTITVQATDRIYAGNDQSTLLDTKIFPAVDVPADTDDMLIGIHTFVYSGSATTFNDVATATYTDKITGIPVPGTTTATASAETTAAPGDPAHSTVVVTDTESITGANLVFSVATPSSGSFVGYTAGTDTTGPVNWTSGPVTNSGSVTFTKTVSVTQPSITSGTLSDTGTITGDGNAVLATANASTSITAGAQVSLTINKSIPSDALRSGESVTFSFDVTGPNSYSNTVSITFDHGGPTNKSTAINGLAPGTYTVSEQPLTNWSPQADQNTTIALPNCSGSVNFTNSELAPSLSVTKDADEDPVTAGDDIGFSIEVSNSGAAGTGTAKDVSLSDPLPTGSGVSWSIESVTGAGGYTPPVGACSIVSNTLSCSFGDLLPGQSVTVHVTSGTTGASCGEYPNVATVNASNHAQLTANASLDVLCPDLEIEKTTSTPVVNAGDQVSYTVTVENDGDGEARDVVISDTLPSGVGWSENSDDCEISGGVLSCGPLDIPAGESFSVTVTGTTDSGDCPSISNTASYTSSNGGSGSTAAAPTVITVNCPDLLVTKDADEDVISAGETASYTITLTNLGPGTAYDVLLEDTLPVGSWTIGEPQLSGFGPGAAVNCASSISLETGQSFSCEIDEMPAGASVTISVNRATTQDDCGLLLNEVSVSASNEPAGWIENNSAEATIIVECPGLNIIKSADESTIDGGETASFTIVVWNAGPGQAFDVTLTDALPGSLAWSTDHTDCTITGNLLECSFGTLGVTGPEGGATVTVSAATTRADCGDLVNQAFADASNQEEVPSNEATITVKCPAITLEKENDTVGSALPGTTVEYTLTLTVSEGPAKDVVVDDVVPEGLESPTSISDGGTFSATTRTITWNLGDLADGTYTLSYFATVADDVENGEELVNAAAATSTNSQCPDLDTLGPECEDTSTVITRVPTLVIDKAADVEFVTVDDDADDIVTWTLTYTLANGPVTNAVISDPIPDGLIYVAGSASDGGIYDAATNTVTWTFPTLTEGGSVTYQTLVDDETISRVDPTLNIATIRSDETPEDEGQDSITVVVEPPPLAGTPTPKPSVPDTALVIGADGRPVTVPVELLVAFFIGSLGALAYANVHAARRRRR